MRQRSRMSALMALPSPRSIKILIKLFTSQAKQKAKAPYSQYDSLASEGVSITWGDPADAANLVRHCAM